MKLTGKVLALFLITFGLGVSVGYFLRGPIESIIKSDAGQEVVQPERTERDERDDRENGERRFREYMITALELSDAQVEPFFEATRVSRRMMRDIMIRSREETQRQIRAESDALNDKLEELLTPDQLDKWNAMQQRYNRERMGGQGPGPGPGQGAGNRDGVRHRD